MENETLKKKKMQFPDTMTILFIILIIAAIVTYIVPAGAYETIVNEDGKETIDPNSYHIVPRTPTTFVGFMTAIPKGLGKQSSIIFMLLLSMGGIQLLKESKAIDAGIHKFISSRKNVEIPVIIFLCFIFGCLGTFAGWNMELLPFIPIVVSIVKAMGYDNMLALHISVWPIAAGWSTGVLNVFSTAILQDMSDLPIFSGWRYRLICFLALIAIGIIFIITYAKKYKKESLPANVVKSNGIMTATDVEATPKFNTRRKVILTVAMLGLILLAYCTTAQGWSLNHVGGFWIIMGMIIGLIDNRKLNDIVESFFRGAKEILPTLIIIGVATAVLIVLEEGNMMNTIINGMANAMRNTHKSLVGVVVFIMLSLLNGLTSSIHGKAVILMPLLIPLADILSVNRQIIVLAFILGDGLTNWFWPTAAIAVASTGAAGVPMDVWLKTSWKKHIVFSVAAGVLVFVASLIGYA